MSSMDTWYEYVLNRAGMSAAAIAWKTGLAESTLSRWQTGSPRVASVVQLAREMKWEPVECLAKAGQVPMPPKLDLTKVPTRALTSELERRADDPGEPQVDKVTPRGVGSNSPAPRRKR